MVFLPLRSIIHSLKLVENLSVLSGSCALCSMYFIIWNHGNIFIIEGKFYILIYFKKLMIFLKLCTLGAKTNSKIVCLTNSFAKKKRGH